MNRNRFEVSGTTLRELGTTEIDAVGGADCGDYSSWTLTTTVTSITTTTTPACTMTTTTTTTTVTATTTTRNEIQVQ